VSPHLTLMTVLRSDGSLYKEHEVPVHLQGPVPGESSATIARAHAISHPACEEYIDIVLTLQ
jgi:hypothetical protein